MLADSVCAEQGFPLLDSVSHSLEMMRRPQHVASFVIFRIIDSEQGTPLDSVEIELSTGEHTWHNQLNRSKQWWYSPGTILLRLKSRGYKAVSLDSLIVQGDKMLVISASMTKENDGILNELSMEEANIEYYSLDSLFPPNSLSGKVCYRDEGSPIEGAIIYCEESNKMDTTDENGDYYIRLDTSKTPTIHVWHPDFDSVYFEVEKQLVRSDKKVHIWYQKRHYSGFLGFFFGSDYEELFVTRNFSWGGFTSSHNRESDERIDICRTTSGHSFGPDSKTSFLKGDYPFYLLFVKDSNAVICFSENLWPTDYDWRDTTITSIEVSSTGVKFNSKTVCGGTTFVVRYFPDLRD